MSGDRDVLRQSILNAFGSSAPAGIDDFIESAAYIARKTRQTGKRRERRDNLKRDLTTLKAAEEVIIRHLSGIPIMADSPADTEQAEASADYQKIARRSKAEVSDMIASLSDRLESMEAPPGHPSHKNLVYWLAERYAEFTGCPPKRNDETFQQILIAVRQEAGIPSPESIQRSLKELPAR